MVIGRTFEPAASANVLDAQLLEDIVVAMEHGYTEKAHGWSGRKRRQAWRSQCGGCVEQQPVFNLRLSYVAVKVRLAEWP